MQTKGLDSKRTPVVAALAVLSLIALAVVGYRWARSDALATLVELSGQPERDTATRKERWLTAAVGDGFASGDGARTSGQSVAHFRLINGARLRLQPSSRVRFHAPGDRGTLELQVDVGQVDVESTSSAVRIDSEFGELSLDPNSSVRLRRDADRLLVDVELGRVEIGDQKQAIGSGQSLELEIGGIRLDLPGTGRPAASLDAGGAKSNVGGAKPQAAPEPPPEPELGEGVRNPDFVVNAGDTFTVHDPSPPPAIGFALAGVCSGPAQLTSAGQTTAAVGQASLRFPRGRHHYEVRCLERPDVVVAKGYVSVLRDSGTRQLPSFAPTANVITDGRRYTVMYQYRLPEVTLSWPAAPRADAYTLEIDGRTLATKSPTHKLAALGSGTHRVAFSAATTPPRRSRTTTIEVVMDTQAPAARVSAPPLGFEPQPSVQIAGQALPGWTVSVGGEPIPLDTHRNFSAQHAGSGVLPIAFSHPSHGTHYYLRRPKAPPP